MRLGEKMKGICYQEALNMLKSRFVLMETKCDRWLKVNRNTGP
jgi:hypothetical protein